MSMEHIVSAFIVLCFGAFITGLGYCIKKIWTHDATLAAVNAKIEGMAANCARHEKWQMEHSKMLTRIDKNVVKVAAKMGVTIDEGG